MLGILQLYYSINIATSILLKIINMLDTVLHKEKPSIICIKISNTIATIHESDAINIKY